MMKQITLFSLLFVASIAVRAQTAFWTEDFAGGLPAGWTTTDGSNQNAIWTWCSDPTAGNNNPGCSPVWDDNTNGQSPFAAATAANGFMTLDSDQYGNLSQDHVSRLTTNALDCSGRDAVFVRFQSHIGVYTYAADGNAILRVSTDQTTWTTFPIFSGLSTQVRWSANPEISIVDISSVAANQGTVYIQWQWTGNYDYMWDLDDIEIFDENPTPANEIALGDIFFPASSYATPASEIQTDTFGFYAFVSNNGLVDQSNVILKVTVAEDNGATLFTDSIQISTLPAGYKDSLIVMNGVYVPQLPVGAYNITYSVRSDSTDVRPENNQKTTQFLATSNFFAKEDEPEQFYRPATLTDPWTILNYYRMSPASQEKYKATSVSFAHTVNEDDLAITDVEASLALYRVNDNIDNDLSNLDDSALLNNFDWVGIGDYIASDTITNDLSVRTSDLLDLNTGDNGVQLENGARYMVAISYAGVNRFVFHGYNDDNKYFFASTLQYGTSFFTFGEEVNAVLRLNLSLVSTTDDRPLPAQAMVVTPNPVQQRLNLAVQLDKTMPVTVTVADMTGRVILSQDYAQVQQEVLSFNVPQLAPGTYLARIATPEGTLTKQFIKL